MKPWPTTGSPTSHGYGRWLPRPRCPGVLFPQVLLMHGKAQGEAQKSHATAAEQIGLLLIDHPGHLDELMKPHRQIDDGE